MKKVNIIKTKHPTNPEEIKKFEEIIGASLHSSYVKHLLQHNGGHPIQNVFPLMEPINYQDINEENEGCVAWFLALYRGEYENIYDYFINFKHRIPKELIPIARNPFGDLICLCVRGDNYGKVYFWDHNWEADDDEEVTYKNVFLIANSFTDFINSLYEPEEEE